MRTWKNGFFLPFLLIFIWYVISELQLFSPYLLPSPAVTAATATDLIHSGLLWQHLLISLQRVAGGFLCSVVIALPLGILCGRSNTFQTYCWPVLEFLRHVPPLAAIPLIILWFGIDEGSKLVIIFLASFSPFFSILTAASKTATVNYSKLAVHCISQPGNRPGSSSCQLRFLPSP
ncbi:MAG: hypothetical protein LUC29_10135 [Acidaminococcaceae bacterium]|nr:hypothetical protein [Acidaminococcaceae bacterium]